MPNHLLTRRTMLRGLGVTMALPWLESTPVWGDDLAGAGSGGPPVRFACLFGGDGFHASHWWAKGNGSNLELSKVLEPLAPHKQKLNFIRGLFNEEALKGSIHSAQTGNLLSGAPLASHGEIRSGTSIDQVIARHMAPQTKVSSLVLGCEKPVAALQNGYSMLYSSHISWSSPTVPTPLELYPALAFDQLFKDSSVAAIRAVFRPAVQRQLGSQRPQRAGRRDERRAGPAWSNQLQRPSKAGRIPGFGTRP